MFTPVSLPKFYIYDVFINDRKKLVIIAAAERQKPEDIYFQGKRLRVIRCRHRHTYVYTSDAEFDGNEITLYINREPYALTPNKYPTCNQIVMSTLLKHEDSIVLEWIKYHKRLGVTHFVFYDNAINSTLSETLKHENCIIIAWPYSYRLTLSGISSQTTSQTHAIWAFNTAKFIGLFDVDEYVNPQKGTLTELLESYDRSKFGGIRLKNKFFYNPEKSSRPFYQITNCDSITKEGREKVFVIPENVEIFSVHMIITGKPHAEVKESDAFFNHYIYLNKSNRGYNKTKLTDDSISRHL